MSQRPYCTHLPRSSAGKNPSTRGGEIANDAAARLEDRPAGRRLEIPVGRSGRAGRWSSADSMDGSSRSSAKPPSKASRFASTARDSGGLAVGERLTDGLDLEERAHTGGRQAISRNQQRLGRVDFDAPRTARSRGKTIPPCAPRRRRIRAADCLRERGQSPPRRSAARQKEIAIRAAMGASRTRVLRQMLTESILLSAIGGAAGLVLSIWLTDLLMSMLPEGAPRLEQIGIDYRVLTFALGVSALTGILFWHRPRTPSLDARRYQRLERRRTQR